MRHRYASATSTASLPDPTIRRIEFDRSIQIVEGVAEPAFALVQVPSLTESERMLRVERQRHVKVTSGRLVTVFEQVNAAAERSPPGASRTKPDELVEVAERFVSASQPP